jgi:tetratricopeptide (TPR) repeat protein
LRDGVASLAAHHSGWRSVDLYARASYYELQGDMEGALEVITTALALAPPLRLPFVGSLCTAHVRVLLQLGRKTEAAQHARSYIKTCSEQGINAPDLYRYAALALATTGDAEAGLYILSQSIQRVEAISQGFALGAFYETRAQLAIEVGDREGFEHFAERCRVEYEKSKNPNVMAKLVQLFDRARTRGLCPEEAVIAVQNSIQPAPDESEYETIQSRIAECVDAADRGRCALTLLLQNTASTLGYLFTVDAGKGLNLMAALPDAPNDRGMLAWLERYVANWLEPTYMDEVTAASEPASTQSTDTGSSEPQCYTDPDGRSLQALPLVGELAEGRKLAAVLVLQVRGHELVGLPRTLTAAIADELLEYGDASGEPSPY